MTQEKTDQFEFMDRPALKERCRELQSLVEQISQLLREYGYGQGELDSDLVDCLKSRLNRGDILLNKAVQNIDLRRVEAYVYLPDLIDAACRATHGAPERIGGVWYAERLEKAAVAIRDANKREEAGE